jgi:hypothetical protein
LSRSSSHRRLVVALLAALVACAFAAPAQAAFPGANGRIAFMPATGGVSVINPDGTGEETLSRTGSLTAHDPGVEWSADGRRLAGSYHTFGLGTETSEVFVVNSDGTGERFISPRSGGFEGLPTWSPDGQRLAFTKLTAQHIGNLATRDTATGTNLRVLNQGPNSFGDPHWSPDGTRFVFERSPNPIGPDCSDLWTVDSRGRNERQLTSGPADDRGADWSPDGTKLVFQSNRDVPGSDCFATHIYVMNADGTNVRRLTFGGLSGTEFESAPHFSPDGRQIVYTRNTAGEVWLMNADGTGQHKLVDGFAQGWQPRPAGTAVPPSPGPAQLTALTVQDRILGGQGGNGTVTLDRAAPTGGVTVALSSGNPAVASVPATVTVPAHRSTASFDIQGGRPAVATTVTVTARLAAVSRQATTSVDGIAALDSVTLPASVGGGLAAQAFVIFTQSAFGETVALTSSNPAVASVPPTITAHGSGEPFVVHTSRVTAPTTVTITATFRGKTASATMVVAAGDPFAAFTLADGAAVGQCPGGAIDSELATVRLSSPSAEAVTVALSSSDPGVEVPASVQVGDSTTFFATVRPPVTAVRTVTLTATALGTTRTAQLRISPCGGTPPTRSRSPAPSTTRRSVSCASRPRARAPPRR